ncbi:PREDICTED: C-type lectin domain family 12 member A [Propithecus coquereli]|uniref:C-type lectin domain family 12 member A n=1 Tax=Propithecus coquereli TaxID=379532 RepID=UPI00063F51DA|nr:PREDICTED: C-type lectin domain family 12 member A [Propithecus coquereli]
MSRERERRKERRREAPPSPSHIWRHTALSLTLLCLLLLVGLGVLGSKFYRSLKIEMEKLDKLQNINEELQRNISLQLMNNISSSNKIRNFSITLQKIATKLCYELYRKNPEHKCKPCPKRWMWHEDSCYLLCNDTQPWQESKMACAAQNASLLKINNKSTLDFIKSQRLYDYWLGLSPRKDYVYSYYELDKIFNSSDWEIRNTTDLNERYCGYLRGIYVDYDDCVKGKKMICEKMANPVKTESILTSDVPDQRM